MAVPVGLLRILGTLFMREVAQRVDSHTIRASLHLAFEGDAVFIRTGYYWARFIHEGRAAITARPGSWLVFFRDGRQDPRLAGGRPERYAQRRLLNMSKAEFREGLRSGKIIMTRHVNAQQGSFFFLRAAEGFAHQVIGPVRLEMDKVAKERNAKRTKRDHVLTFRI